MKKLFIYFIPLAPLCHCLSQSIEVMPGTERIFFDVQWLKAFDENYKWTLFSRSRATAEYDDDNTNLFTGAYLNYTTKLGIGATILGRISNNSSGFDTGIHYFKNGKNFMIYALPSITLKSDLGYSWFSIMRYTPKISKKWGLYSSLELFSNFDKEGHVASVQRIRLGANHNSWQFGLAVNLTGVGINYRNVDTNPGIFLRKTFE